MFPYDVYLAFSISILFLLVHLDGILTLFLYNPKITNH
jgi:hypothetical protein